MEYYQTLEEGGLHRATTEAVVVAAPRGGVTAEHG